MPHAPFLLSCLAAVVALAGVAPAAAQSAAIAPASTAQAVDAPVSPAPVTAPSAALALPGAAADAAGASPRAACTPILPVLQAAYPGLAALPAPEDHPGNTRYRVDAQRVLDLAPEPGEPFNAHVVTCKAWPARPDLWLVAVPLIDPNVPTDEEHRADLEVLVVDAATGRAQQRLRLPDAVSDDAVMLRALAFDTARYRLAPDDLAFGLRLVWENNSRANPFGETTLFLFDRPAGDDGALRLVLNKLSVSRDSGEWDTNCAGEFHSTSAVLSMGSTASHGLQDIIVRDTFETRKNTAKAEDCVETVTDRGVRQDTLRFDGQRYAVPAG